MMHDGTVQPVPHDAVRVKPTATGAAAMLANMEAVAEIPAAAWNPYLIP